MTLEQGLVILAGALAGGFVNGLTGFGTGLMAIGIWLHALPPATAALLVIACSLVSQLQNLPLIWGRIEWPRALPFLIPGLVGVPVGAAALAFAEARPFKLGIGFFLLIYAGLALVRVLPERRLTAGRIADGMVGWGGGVLGGIAGLSGALLALWTDLRGDGKAARRTLLQIYNLTILMAALAGHAATGNLTADFGAALLVALPGTVVSAWLGVAVYRSLGDKGFRQVMLVLLLVSGAMLVATNR